MLEITALLPEHWPVVRSIYLEGVATGHATFEMDAPEWAEWDQDHLSCCRLVARRDDHVVGWAALSPVSRRRVYAGVAEVSIYVAGPARRDGVGTALLGALVEESERAGIWTLQAAVFPENRATIRLHTNAGFREVGHRHRIGRLNGEWRDTVLLERRSTRAGVE
jgi:phosphinothricin acetyltransferase